MGEGGRSSCCSMTLSSGKIVLVLLSVLLPSGLGTAGCVGGMVALRGC